VPKADAELVMKKVQERIAKEDAWMKVVEGGGCIAIDSANDVIAAKDAEII
jgi:hypothetical protein